MISRRTWLGEFLFGTFSALTVMLSGFVYLLCADRTSPTTWLVAWAWSLIALVMLTPLITGPGQLICFAILGSLRKRWRWSVPLIFGIVCVTVYFTLSKVIAAALLGIFVIFGLVATIAFHLHRDDIEPNKPKMCLKGVLSAMVAYPLLVSAAFCGVFVSAVEIGRRYATDVHPLEMKLKPSAQGLNGLEDVRGELHVHSFLSHDSRGTLKEIAAAAKKNNIRWIILTDHISALPEEKLVREIDGVRFIYGNERNWHKQGSHFRMPLDSTNQLHLYGHAELLKTWDGEKWDAFELVNFHANALEKKWEILFRIFADPARIYDELDYVRPENLRRWQELAELEKRPMPIFAGPDAHQNIRMIGSQADPYELIFHRLSTHIWLEKEKPLSQEQILRSIKLGRTYVAFEALGDPTGFQFWAEKDEKQFFTGDTVSVPEKLFIRIPKADGVALKLYRDRFPSSWIDEHYSGTEGLSRWIDPQNFYYAIPSKGFWRVEVWRFGKPWIISGQILVK